MPHTRYLYKAMVLFIVLVAGIPEYCYSHSHGVNYFVKFCDLIYHLTADPLAIVTPQSVGITTT